MAELLYQRPSLQVLTQTLLERIIEEALDILERIGVFIESEKTLKFLEQQTIAKIDRSRRRAYLPKELVQQAINSCPKEIVIYDREGSAAMKLTPWNVYFSPGSTAIKILDMDTETIRAPKTADLCQFAKLTDALKYIDMQSTALVPADVPAEISDRYRLYIALQESKKPIITGTFTIDGFKVMSDMLSVVAESLKAEPIAIFDICPSPPLKFSKLSSETLMELAKAQIPAELVSMPILGATAPLLITNGLVQHTAENLSGIVIHQATNPGAPIIYGGSPSILDMRHGTTAIAAIESLLVCCGLAQVGRYFNLPIHSYMGLSDAKIIDAQAGMESAVGTVLAALSGINIISGAGMLCFESCQSIIKLVIDNELIGMVKHLIGGIKLREEKLSEDLYGEIEQACHFLTSPITIKYLRDEIFQPSNIIERLPLEEWQRGKLNICQRAKIEANRLLESYQPKPLPADKTKELNKIMLQDAKSYGLLKLPYLSACC